MAVVQSGLRRRRAASVGAQRGESGALGGFQKVSRRGSIIKMEVSLVPRREPEGVRARWRAAECFGGAATGDQAAVTQAEAETLPRLHDAHARGERPTSEEWEAGIRATFGDVKPRPAVSQRGGAPTAEERKARAEERDGAP